MPFVKSINGHSLSCRSVESYLENGRKDNPKSDRVVRRAFLNVDPADQRDWAEAFDRTRRIYGANRPWKGKPAITYRHFVLSPEQTVDEHGELTFTPDELLDYARDWVAHEFGDEDGPGRLGRYESVIILHDDSEMGNLHAHIVVNSVNLDSGRRMQISDADNRAISDDAQTIARAHGLSYLDWVTDADGQVVSASKRPDQEPEHARRKSAARGRRDHRPSTQRIYQTDSERQQRAKGEHMWKDDIRMAAAVCACAAAGLPAFIAMMQSEFGMLVEERPNGDLLYHHSISPDSKKCYGRKLGAAFTLPGIRSAIATADVRRRLYPDAPDSKEAQRYTVTILTSPPPELDDERMMAMVAAKVVTGVQDADGIAHEIARCEAVAAKAGEGTIAHDAALSQAAALRDLLDYGADAGLVLPGRKLHSDAVIDGLDFKTRLRRGLKLTRAERAQLDSRQLADWRRARAGEGARAAAADSEGVGSSDRAPSVGAPEATRSR